ncbi:hypothetical protein [Bacillus cereus]|uniref:hypothetical protein n=1 Tax=Bacillus cereus TaxID=1396 RepID=UPI000B4ABBF0|nr:hypothetical protein [Bacillus cereus]
MLKITDADADRAISFKHTGRTAGGIELFDKIIINIPNDGDYFITWTITHNTSSLQNDGALSGSAITTYLKVNGESKLAQTAIRNCTPNLPNQRDDKFYDHSLSGQAILSLPANAKLTLNYKETYYGVLTHRVINIIKLS